MRRTLMVVSSLLATFGTVSAARADQDVTIPEIVVVEFGDPYFVGTFRVYLNPDTKFVAGASKFQVWTPPDVQLFGASGPSDRPWQAIPTVATNTVDYSLFNGGPALDIIVPPAPVGSPLDLGLFKFTTYAAAYNYPAFLQVRVIGLQTAGGSPLPTQTYDVPVRFVPEPATLAMVGLGLAGVMATATARRVRIRFRAGRPVSAG